MLSPSSRSHQAWYNIPYRAVFYQALTEQSATVSKPPSASLPPPHTLGRGRMHSLCTSGKNCSETKCNVCPCVAVSDNLVN
jgi:hypothetical protein